MNLQNFKKSYIEIVEANLVDMEAVDETVMLGQNIIDTVETLTMQIEAFTSAYNDLDQIDQEDQDKLDSVFSEIRSEMDNLTLKMKMLRN